MIVRVRRARVPSVFALALVLSAAVGLVVGGAVAAATALPVPEGYQLTLLDRLGLWALVVFPVVYGLAGGLAAAVAALLYNLAAAVTGGIRVDLRELGTLEEEAPGEEAPEEHAPEEGASPREAADDT